MTARYDLDERQALLRGRLAFQTMFLLMALMLVNACAVSSGLDWGGPFDQVALICLLAYDYFSFRSIWRNALVGVGETPLMYLGPLAIGGLTAASLIYRDLADGTYSFWSLGRAGQDFVWTLFVADALLTAGVYAIRLILNRREASA